MERATNKSPSDAIIISSSEDDEDEDVEELFKAFVSKIERFVREKEYVILLQKKFAEARPELLSSAKFKNSLRWRMKQLDETNGYIYTGDIFNLLAADSKDDHSKSESSAEKSAIDHRSSCTANQGVTKHSTCGDTGGNKNVRRVTIDTCEEDKPPAVLRGQMTLDVPSPQPSTSSANVSTSERAESEKTGKMKASETDRDPKTPKRARELTPRKRKRLLRRLEGKMKHISERIKILSQAELSLDEMNMNDSTYIQECRLKDCFNRIWNKMCRIKGRRSDTGRVIEKEVKCPPTGFPEIDKAISKFLKRKRGRFPDRFDISNIILETKKKHGLKITPQVLREISDDVFVHIGNTLQKRRQLDFRNNSGSFLTDNCIPGNDPALNDSSLLKKLEENKKVNKRALDEVFNKYTYYGRVKNRSSGDESTSEPEDSNPENNLEGNRKRRFSRISVAESSDSSDKECDDLQLKINGTSDKDQTRGMEWFDCDSLSQSGVQRKPSALMSGDVIGSDLEDDFETKKPKKKIRRTCAPESIVKHSHKNNVALQFSEIDRKSNCATVEHLSCAPQNSVKNGHKNNVALLSSEIDLESNCAIVELPSSVLPECVDITAEQTSVAEVLEACDGESSSTPQHFEAQTTVEIDDGDKQVVLETHEDTSVPDTSGWEEYSASRQNSDLMEDKKDPVTTQFTSDISSAGLSNLVTSSGTNSSDSQNVVGDEVSVEKYLKRTDKHGTSNDFVFSRNDKGVANKLARNPTLVSPSFAESGNEHKSLLISLQIKKRKAQNGSVEYKSPLKIFRKESMETVRNKEISPDDRDGKEEEFCETSGASSAAENDEPHITAILTKSASATVNSYSPGHKNGPRKLSLSLNRNGRSFPKANIKSASGSDVIVLSDDDSDN